MLLGFLAKRWDAWGRDAVTAVAVGLAVFAVARTEATVGRLDRESKQRQDQSCRITEAKQQADVDALEQTYMYLASLSSRQLAEPLNRTILASLPRTIRDAQLDDAPAYCRRPGVGLDPSGKAFPQPPANLPSP